VKIEGVYLEEGILLNIAGIISYSEANGPGRRTCIWVQGCSIKCKGCVNEHTHPHDPKYLIPPEDLAKWIEGIEDIEGITVSGGEPFEQAAGVANLIELIKSKNLSVFVFTGYNYQDLKDSNNNDIQRFLSHIDILCSGPFIQSKKDESLLWRGSTNQELIYLSDRYNSDMEEAWLDSSPAKEIHIESGKITFTGFPWKEGSLKEVIDKSMK